MLFSGVTAHAAASAASERERLEGFAAFVQGEGLTGGVVGYGESDENGETVFPDAAGDARMQGMLEQMREMDAVYGPVVRDVVTVIREPERRSASEAMRLSSMASLAQEAAAYVSAQEEALYDASAAEAAGVFMPAGAHGTPTAGQGYGETAAGDAVDPRTPEEIIRAAEQQVLSRGFGQFAASDLEALRREVSGTLSGNSFPTTNWQRFGTELVDLGTFTLTAYDPCILCCGKTDGITATGTKGQTGRTIAVDPSVIPYGSRVLIGGYVFIAEDTGGAIRGKHIDLFMDTHEIAMRFGKREAQVQLIQ